MKLQHWFGTRIAALVLALACVCAATPALAQGPSRSNVAPASATSAGPRTLVVDRHAIMLSSKVGQDIKRQVDSYEASVQSQFGGTGQALQKEMETLQQEAPNLAPDVRAKKIDAFQAKEADFRQKVQARQRLIQGGEMLARDHFQQTLAPILHAIMLERGANLLLDKSTVVDDAGDIDVTQTAIQRLDQKLSKLKVQLANPPESASILMH